MTDLTRKGFLGLAAGAGALAAASSHAAARHTPTSRTLIRGADLLTMDPAHGEVAGADVLIENGRIAAIGRGLSADDAEVVEAAGMILMPGLIDGHRHNWEGLEAGRLVKTHPGEYSNYQEWKMRVLVSMTPEDFYLAEHLGGLQALDSGVTTMLNYAHAHHTTEKAVQAAQGFIDSGIAGVFAYQWAHNPTYGPGDTVPLAQAVAERLAPSTAENFRTAETLKQRFFAQEGGRVRFGLATTNSLLPSGQAPQSMEQVTAELALARSLSPFLICMHVHRPKPMPPEGRFRGVGDLGRAGLLGPDLHFSHGVELEDEELAMMAANGCMLCSTCMGEFPYPAAPIHGKARAAGVAVGNGVDVTIALNQDYFEHVRASFWGLYRSPEYARIAAQYTSEDILDFSTRLGAAAVRMGGETGTITQGKHADLVLLRTDRIGFASLGTLADRVVGFANTSDVDSVWVRGEARKRGGVMLGVDWRLMKARVEAAQERIGRSMASITFTE